MSDILGEMQTKMVSTTASSTDSIVARAVLLATGQQLTILDICKRLSAVRYGVNPGYSIIYLDNEPILELHDPHVGGSSLLSRDPDDAVYRLTVTQNYKLLGKAAAAHNARPSTAPADLAQQRDAEDVLEQKRDGADS